MRRYHSPLPLLLLLAGLLSFLPGLAQRGNILQTFQNGLPQMQGGQGGSDSLKRRNKQEDSITISFRYLDTAGRFRVDSSILDFYRRFPIPFTHQWLGNTGGASRPLLFQGRSGTGFDPGFHAYDAYRWTLDGVRFHTTTRPYSELAWILGRGGQQVIDLVLTQNLKPTWNVGVQYRLISSPGLFNNQNTNHNNYLLTSWYQSPRKRYNNYLVLLGNKLQASENGGILTDANYLDDPRFTADRYGIPTQLSSGTTRNTGLLANTSINTGNRYNEFRALLRQQYDLGRKDSLVTDSTVIPLFFPRLRIEHTLTYAQQKFTYADNRADSAYYFNNYGFYLAPNRPRSGRVAIRDTWKELTNDVSIYQFPDPRNLQQYFRVGAAWQQLSGEVRDTLRYTNIWVHGEYRNRTRNQKWDMLASGVLHLAGYNAGDAYALLRLSRVLGPRLGSLQVGFENALRTPPFLYDARSNFYFDVPKGFAKENTTRFFGNLDNPRLRLQLGAEYLLIANYLYVTGYRELQQAPLFNLLRLRARKVVRLNRRFNLDTEAWLQQQPGNGPVHVPLLFAVSRLAYEGNFGFRNLTAAIGLEGRYHTPYKADAYSPVIGQFSFQDTLQISNRPDINAFFHFRIRGFKAFLRAENLNTLRFRAPAGFREHNFAAPGYPYPALVIRFGIYWSFVN